MNRMTCAYLIALCVVGMAPVNAQSKVAPKTSATAPAPDEAKAAAPTFTEDDVLLLQALNTVGQLANTECQALESVKKFQQQRQQAVAHFEKKYPGFTVNWQTASLVAKAPVAAVK